MARAMTSRWRPSNRPTAMGGSPSRMLRSRISRSTSSSGRKTSSAQRASAGSPWPNPLFSGECVSGMAGDSTPPPPRRLAAITRHIRGATPSCGPRASSFRAAALSLPAKASSDAAAVVARRAAPASRAAARARCGGSASSIFRLSLRPSPPKEDGPAEWPSRSCCGAALRDRSRDGPGRRTARAARRPATGASRPPPRTPPRPSGPWPPPRSGARAAGRGR